MLVAVLGALVLYVLSWPDFGGSLEGARLERAQKSKQYRDGAFANDPPPPESDYGVNFAEWRGDQVRRPPAPFPLRRPSLTETPEPGLRAIWFGHATVLVEIGGRRVMTDPILSDQAFPVKLVAPRRNDPPPIALEQLPRIDVVTISHDHFDHLDMATDRESGQAWHALFRRPRRGRAPGALGGTGNADPRAGLVGNGRARGAEDPLHTGPSLFRAQIHGQSDALGVLGARVARAPRLPQWRHRVRAAFQGDRQTPRPARPAR